MPDTYTFLPDLTSGFEIPANGILSQTVHQDDRAKIILFGFSEGQELSAHTAPMPAILHFLKGSATVRLGADTVDAQPGSLVYMPPLLEHGIHALTPVVVMLIMIKNQQ
jgi:quercetin dioxygenase-like cupin family protein